MNNSLQLEKQVWIIAAVAAVFGVCMMLFSLVYFNSISMAEGVFLGCLLGVANLVFLTKIVVKIFNQNYKHKLIIALFFLLKLLFIVLIIGLSFWVLKVHVKAFAAGYLCLIVAMTTQQVLGTKKDRL